MTHYPGNLVVSGINIMFPNISNRTILLSGISLLCYVSFSRFDGCNLFVVGYVRFSLSVRLCEVERYQDILLQSVINYNSIKYYWFCQNEVHNNNTWGQRSKIVLISIFFITNRYAHQLDCYAIM